MKFPLTLQNGNTDCGPACLKMVAEYYGKFYDLSLLKKKCYMRKQGVSMLGISKCAASIGLHCDGIKLNIEQLKEIVQETPVILHWNKNHFVIVFKAPKPGKGGIYQVADPAIGFINFEQTQFMENWISRGKKQSAGKHKSTFENGYALLIKPKSSQQFPA